jgi:hypothetical protein
MYGRPAGLEWRHVRHSRGLSGAALARAPNDAKDDLPAAVQAAGLTGLQAARLSMTRRATGSVIRADPSLED